jgi:hypothetical protein
LFAAWRYDVTRSSLTFSWTGGAYDGSNSSTTLTYRIWVATNPTASAPPQSKFMSIISPAEGSPLRGAYLRPALKNWPGIGVAHGLQLAGAPDSADSPIKTNTTYYYRVQTIDAALNTSAWSPESTIYTSTTTKIWDGGGADNNWTTAANWSPDGVPNASNAVVFDGTNNKICTMDALSSVGSFLTTPTSTATIQETGAIQILTVNGDFAHHGGSFGVYGGINVGGNWTKGAGSSFSWISLGAASVRFNGQAQTLSGSTTFYRLYATTPGTTLYFTAGTTNYVTEQLTISSTSLLSTTDGAPWYFNYSGTTQTISNVLVKDSNAGAGKPVVADAASADLGNNVNWVFPESVQTSSSSVATNPFQHRRLARDSAGRYWAVYLSTGSGALRIYLSSSTDGIVWAPPIGVPVPVTNPSGQNAPSIAIDNNDRIHLTWLSLNGSQNDVFWSVYGSTWVTPVQISGAESTSGATKPAVVIDSNGNPHIVYIGEGTQWEVYYKNYAGGWPGSPELVSNGSGMSTNTQNNPDVHFDAWDQPHVVWEGLGTGDTSAQIYYSSRTAGSWGTPVRISTLGGMSATTQATPVITVNSSGTIDVVWAGRATGDTQNQIYHARFTNGSWSAPTKISTLSGMASVAETSPMISVDQALRVHVFWYANLGNNNQIYHAIMDGTWSSPVAQTSTGANLYVAPRMAFHWNNGGNLAWIYTQGSAIPYSVVFVQDSAYPMHSDWTPPAAVTTLSGAAGTNAGDLRLTWRAPGDSGVTGALAPGSA